MLYVWESINGRYTVFAGVHVHIHTRVWKRSEVKAEYLPQSFSVIFLRVSLTEARAHQLGRTIIWLVNSGDAHVFTCLKLELQMCTITPGVSMDALGAGD